MALGKADYLKLVPEEIKGWKAVDEGLIYDQDTLYDYIDGGAELYISYKFVNVFSRQYQKEDEPAVNIEIFDMGESKYAYGVFSNSKEFVNQQTGQGGQYIEGSLMFWKDNFFVSIYSDYEDPDAKDCMLEMASVVDGNINTEGNLPDILNLLPEQGLDKNSIVFFIHHAWQNYYHYIDTENIFSVSEKNEAVMAKYNVDGSRVFVMVITYQEQELQSNIFKEVHNHFEKSDITSPDILTFGNDKIGMFFLKNKSLILIIADTKELLMKMKNKFEN